MRLTLRTLLSYLDGVHLSDDEREAIREQLDASENASEWIHRTRDVMRRLKLGAPEIDGTGSADDPNSVAEYLDRTLPDESVAEFERFCLESDIQLAEVASCHHALAMFLSERLDIDPDTRNRLHRLQADLTEATQARVEHPHTGPVIEPREAAMRPTVAPPVETPSPSEPEPVAPSRRRRAASDAGESHVPGYLRERQVKQWAPAAAALVLLAVTAGIAFMPGGPLNPTKPAEIVDRTDSDPIPDSGSGSDSGLPDVPPAEPEPEVPPVVEPVADPVPNVEPSSEPGEVTVDDPEPVDEVPEAGTPGAAETDPEPPEETETEQDSKEAEAAEPPVVTFESDPTTIAAYELTPGNWRRLEKGFKLTGPTRVLSLPNYRSAFSFGPMLQVELVSLTDARIIPPTDASAPLRMDLAYGRVLLTTAVAAEKPIELEVILEGEVHTASIEPGTVLAIRADRPFQPGWPVEDSSPPLVAVADTLAGVVEWAVGDRSERVPTQGGKRLTDADTDSLIASLGGNEWIDQLPISRVDEDAAAAVAQSDAVLPNKPLWPQLRAIASEDDFQERRALAARATLALNHPESLVETFRDEGELRSWERNLAWLRQAASRSRATATAIRRVFEEKISPLAANELMELLVGFTAAEIGSDPESLARGSVAGVILPGLESPEFAIRVLAGLALKEAVTGAEPKDEPEFDARRSDRRREASVRVIRDKLSKGRLVPRQAAGLGAGA